MSAKCQINYVLPKSVLQTHLQIYCKKSKCDPAGKCGIAMDFMHAQASSARSY
jgi:hypothetical protein